MKNIINFSKLKIFSIKDILTTRVYFSSIVNTISNEFIKEGPSNIFQTIETDNNNSNNNNDIYTIILHNNYENSKIIITHNFNNIIILLLIIIFYINIKNKNNNNNLKKLDNFIEYYKIKHKINIILTIFIFIFVKNIENVY
jgi:hypothetical protein